MFQLVFEGRAFGQEVLNPAQARFYFWVALFTAGNLIFPAVAHAFPHGGPALLPLYFFTLIAAYRWGIWAGLATALLSPLASTALTGMPPFAILDTILVKSVVLAFAAAWVAARSRRVSLVTLLIVVVTYQLLGGLYEIVRSGQWTAALTDWRFGWPGLLIQVIGGGLIAG
ncbi:MAG: ECF transporter S component, partial [Spirochaetales bacterium]|nr:ECF transporter S component [Spirochaetales bacterium]